MLSTADPAAKLVELTQAKAFRVLHHHQRGIRNVHSHLHYGGGNQDIHLTCREGVHDFILFRSLHPAVEKRQAKCRKHLVPQLFIQFFCAEKVR